MPVGTVDPKGLSWASCIDGWYCNSYTAWTSGCEWVGDACGGPPGAFPCSNPGDGPGSDGGSPRSPGVDPQSRTATGYVGQQAVPGPAQGNNCTPVNPPGVAPGVPDCTNPAWCLQTRRCRAGRCASQLGTCMAGAGVTLGVGGLACWLCSATPLGLWCSVPCIIAGSVATLARVSACMDDYTGCVQSANASYCACLAYKAANCSCPIPEPDLLGCGGGGPGGNPDDGSPIVLP